MRENQPLVSIILLSYNHEKFISKAIDGILSQDYNNLEIIISDDCSSDASKSIILEKTKNNITNNIKLNFNKFNLGLVNHLNYLFDNFVTGEYIVLASGDDFSFHQRVTQSVQLMTSNDDVFLSDLSVELYDTDKNKKLGNDILEDKIYDLNYFNSHQIKSRGCARIFKKEVLEFFGPFNKDCPTEDTTLLLRGLLLGKIKTSSSIGVKYSIHLNSLSSPKNLPTLSLRLILKQYLNDSLLAFRKRKISFRQFLKLLLKLFKTYLKRRLFNRVIISKIKETFYAAFVKYPSWLLGIIKGNVIKTHWGRSTNNFGDCLSPYILKHYGFTPIYSQTIDSDIIMAGTILQWTPQNYRGVVFGTGCDDLKIDLPHAKILGVRGKLTKNNLPENIQNSLFLGDPGLIMNKVFPEKIEKQYKLGIVPHFVDEDCEIVKNWIDKFKNQVILINVLRDAKVVIQEIKQCEYIVSSSLHGLITADSFDIPNVRFVNRKTMPTYFYDYKFDDYYSSLNSVTRTIEATGQEDINNIINQCRLHSVEVSELQEKLDEEFKKLKTIL